MHNNVYPLLGNGSLAPVSAATNINKDIPVTTNDVHVNGINKQFPRKLGINNGYQHKRPGHKPQMGALLQDRLAD
jgi:hypothetical protein